MMKNVEESKSLQKTLFFILKNAFFLFLFASCYRGHLYVQQEWVDKNFLASTHVKTPDPLQDHPPKGQNLHVSWDFPRSVFEKNLFLFATFRFKNQKEEIFSVPLTRKRGYKTFYFPLEKDPQKKLLTYQVKIATKKGEILEEWNHHFWTRIIEEESEERVSKKS